MKRSSIGWVVAAAGLISLGACGGDEESDNGGAGGSSGKAGAAGTGGGKGGAAGSGGTASGGTAGTSSCTTIDADVRAFIAANKSCTAATDCVTAAANCWTEQEDCCVIYLNASYDTSTWTALMANYSACQDAGTCGCCAAVPRDPTCNAGKCGPKM